jgi:hypothetical protein
VRTTFSDADFTAEAVMLTGGLNVAVVEWISGEILERTSVRAAELGMELLDLRIKRITMSTRSSRTSSNG